MMVFVARLGFIQLLNRFPSEIDAEAPSVTRNGGLNSAR
jgi:hypothetical protein